jgi:hypothetical protein
MSQRKYRKYYEPWKLCFKRVEVSYTSGKEADLDLGHDELTLCGTLLHAAHSGVTRISTIGGLLEVNGHLMALTTSFDPQPVPFGAGRNGNLDATDSSAATTLNDIDFPDDVAEALVFESGKAAACPAAPPDIDGENMGGVDRGPVVIFQPDIAAPITPVRGAAGHKADCRLIPVKDQYELPNIVWFSGPSDKDQQASRHYITDFCRNPSLASVMLSAGVSGTHSGIMSVGPSLIDGKYEPLEVWSLHLDGGTGNYGQSSIPIDCETLADSC